MSKETSIVFIYDTKKLQSEYDDPATAILYFHPTWVSDNQKTVLCGQLMGMIHCLRRVFDVPEIITLESGKFCINFNGNDRYLLAVGTDRNVPDWLLRHRRNLLTSLIKFYHNSIEEMEGIYGNCDALNAKIYHVCETYLKIVSLSNMFSVIPTISLPKSGSNVFIETVNILQYCQTFDNVLGGLILYHNKVVATQISSELTKLLVLSDPYRIKNPAENVTTNFNLPLGVQLLHVYISQEEFEELVENSERIKRIFRNFNRKDNGKVISKLKRDCSLLFTSVPEEDTEITVLSEEQSKKPIRPKFLALKNKISSTYEYETKSKTPYTPFNPGSVISTPMTELNKILHVNTYSICTDPEKKVEKKFDANKRRKTTNTRQRSDSLILKRRKVKIKKRSNSVSDPTEIFALSKKSIEELNALRTELISMKISKNISKNRKSLTLPLKSFNFDCSNTDVAVTDGLLTPLMQKLSCTTENKSSGFGSYTPTPFEYKDIIPMFKRNNGKLKKNNKKIVKCTLFVVGQQDTVLLMLLKEECVENENLINALWEMSTSKLGGLEKQLNQCLEPNSGNNLVQEQEPYSFLQLDSSQWNMVRKGGAWGMSETSNVMKLHRDFLNNRGITEILCKGNESILFGVHNNGDSEVYYHQSESNNFGLPTPSDSMAHVPMRAKRSLERDHSIILL